MPVQARHQLMNREKAPPPMDPSLLFGTLGSSERPGSIRDAIIRWLNEEL